MSGDAPSRIVVAITGASGAVLGVRTLQVLRELGGYETHLVITRGGRSTLREETDLTAREVAALADHTHSDADLGAAIASGSFRTHAMVVAPCSIKTLSAVANCYSATLVARAADVMLKERRPLVLLVRETPLHRGHLRLMDQAAEAGAIIQPPVPAFYAHPASPTSSTTPLPAPRPDRGGATEQDAMVGTAVLSIASRCEVARWLLTDANRANGKVALASMSGERPARPVETPIIRCPCDTFSSAAPCSVGGRAVRDVAK